MNIEKIIKKYFFFTLMVIAIAAGDQVVDNKQYMASVLNAFDGVYNVFDNSLSDKTTIQSTPVITKQIDFKIVNDPEKTLTSAGEKDKEIMRLVFKSDDEDIEVKKFKFKISGNNSWMIENARINIDKEVIGNGKISDNYLIFDGLNYKAQKGTEVILSVRIDLSGYIASGERFRLDIESPRNVVIWGKDADISIGNDYPIYGKYLSIAQRRSWKKALKH